MMAVFFDSPLPIEYRRFRIGAHLMSDLPGEEGTRELTAFAESIGLRAEWIQEAGTPREHFDLLGSNKIWAARVKGAREVTRRRVVEVIEAKRAKQDTANG